MARKQEDPVKLSDAEREELEAIVSKGKHKARVIRRAQTVLWSDAGNPYEAMFNRTLIEHISSDRLG